VFLSSTLYDLRQVRADIGAFVETLGYGLLDSTDPRFVVDPHLDKYEACLREVQNSDMLILVIGGRYGSEPPGTSSSITNQEWELAHSRRIPIFTFVDRTVWDTMRVWTRNPEADFTPTVEDSRVFDFIHTVSQGTRNNWIWPFGNAAEIVDVLRRQWAGMFAEQLHEHLDRDVVTVLPSRHALIGEYAKRVRAAVTAVDMLGVSLMTVARSAGLEAAIREACSREVPVRVLTMSHESPAAPEREAEEFGKGLVAELESAASIWQSFTDELPTASVRHYSTRAALFYFRVDDARFVSLYPTGDSGANAPTFAFSRVTDVAEYFQQRFELVWESAASP
jgi:hypothetical protein